ncbi:MAG TPA: ABC transporter substrate-binding protein [Ilumatobacter sp.]|nr:ABC transporter substrate-binding protein [Ilumatobacter sp.]
MSRSRLAALPLVAALALAACGGGDDDTTAPGTTPAPGTGGDGAPAPTAAPGVSDPGEAGDDGTGDDDGGDGPIVVTLPPGTVPEAAAVAGGTLRVALEAEVDGLNPVSSQVTAAAGLMMAAAVFDTLAATDTAGDPVPYLAESFTPNDDFTTWDVKLREGITFHDGTALDALAVQRNFETQLADPLVGLAVKPFHPAEGATEIIDEYTIRYTLSEPNVRFPARLTTQIGMVASPTWLDAAIADATLNQRPVGTGPFVFDSRSEDSVTRFVRNDDYWNGEVYLDAIEFVPVTDGGVAADLLYNGEVDALHTTDPGTVADLRSNVDAFPQQLLDDSGDDRFIIMNTAKPPFDDVRARQALAYATPRQLVLDLFAVRQWRPASQRFIPESPYHNPDLVQVGDDADRAVALAAEYCAERGGETNPVTNQPTCSNGKINIEYQWSGPSVSQTRLADVLVDGWGAAFNVTRDEKLQDQNILEVVTGGYNAVSWTQFNDPEPINDNVWVLCRTAPAEGIALNFSRYCDEQRDALLVEAAATVDDAARAELVQQAEARINESFTYVFLGHVLWDYALASNVHGLCDRTSPEGTRLMCVRQGNFWPTTVWID